MKFSTRTRGRLPSRVISLGLGAWVATASVAFGFGDGPYSVPNLVPNPPLAANPDPKSSQTSGLFTNQNKGCGILSYGPQAPQPGYQGFGLKYHLGYGYGGQALGTTANGGYPYYGGPGYPHPWPKLQRIGGINPFRYYGGPGGPTANCPNFYGQPGPLTLDPPVVTPDPDLYQDDFGSFTGVVNYPESVFAPFATEGERPPSGPQSTTPAVPPPPPPAEGGGNQAPSNVDPGVARSRFGIDAEPLHRGGLLVTKVHADRPATRAGLAAGDVIRAANGVPLLQPGDLDRVVRTAGAAGPIRLEVKTARGGDVRTVTTEVR